MWHAHYALFVWTDTRRAKNHVFPYETVCKFKIPRVLSDFRSQWPRGLRRVSWATPFLGIAGSNPAGGVDIRLL